MSLAKEETAAVIKSSKKVIENKAASICEKEMIEGGKAGKAKDQYNKAACLLEQVGRQHLSLDVLCEKIFQIFLAHAKFAADCSFILSLQTRIHHPLISC